jgi:hypothetical protein
MHTNEMRVCKLFLNYDFKKSDALVGCVNTYIILHTKEFKIPFKIWNLLETLKFTNFKILRL